MFSVMPGLVPGIHVLLDGWKNVEGRDRPGHDELGYSPFHPHVLSRSRKCAGAGATTRTGSLFFEIGITISRECRCRIGSPKREIYCSLRRRRKLACVP